MVIHKVLFAVFVLNSVMPSFFIETMKLSCGTDEIEQIKAQTEVRLLSGKEPKPQLPSWSRLKMYRRSQEIHDSRSETASAKHTDLSYFESSFPDCAKIFFISAEDVCTAG
jgi:membrane-associated HD superfamily phosphohydrolase